MKKIILIGLALAFFGQIACKDDGGSDPTPNSSTGKLTDSDKALLMNKKWFDHLGAFNHQYKNDGTYIINDGLVGTWKWRNKGDTMDLVNNGDAWAQVWVSIKATEAQYKTNQAGLGFKDIFTLKTNP